MNRRSFAGADNGLFAFSVERLDAADGFALQPSRRYAHAEAYVRRMLGEAGLATKMLLGDTSDATAMDFILPAMRDPEALRHVAAVSFHSWRGWTDEILAYAERLLATFPDALGHVMFTCTGSESNE